MANTLYYWLVGVKGNLQSGTLPKGGPSKVVVSATAPAGYDFTKQLAPVGASKKAVTDALGKALPDLPTGIAVAKSYTIPGVGTSKVNGAGGLSGAADQGFTTAGNTISSAAGAVGSITSFITSGQNWIRLLEVIAGAVLIVMGLHQLTGIGDGAVSAAKTAGRAAAVVA